MRTKIYGIAEHLAPIKGKLSDLIHSSLVDVLEYPNDRRFQRFIALDPSDCIFPPDRSIRYLLIEIDLFEGRSVQTKKRLIRVLYERICLALDLDPDDLEIHLIETPRSNWGLRGKPADEHPDIAYLRVRARQAS